MHWKKFPSVMSLLLGLQVFRAKHTARAYLAFGEMQTSGLKESCRYTSEGKRGSSQNTAMSVFPRKPSIPSSFTTSNSLCTSPSLYLVFFQFIDLYLEAEAADLRLPSSLTHMALLGGKNQA